MIWKYVWKILFPKKFGKTFLEKLQKRKIRFVFLLIDKLDLIKIETFWVIKLYHLRSFKNMPHTAIKIFTENRFDKDLQYIHSYLQHIFGILKINNSSTSAGHPVMSVIPWTVACQVLLSWNSPGKNIGVGSHAVFQGIFLTQESNLVLPGCRGILYILSHQGIPKSIIAK